MPIRNKQIIRRRRGGGGGLPASLLYAVNGLAPKLVMDFTRGKFHSDACGQYEVNGLSPVLVAEFAQGQYYQKDCAA